ncbi:PREDICTED: enhancer of split m8 protein-like [Rhagoletis zephyria]|uniref:enhancer of split m8 protein-like n=1 Tax=Rhagoletis zephyria TaxID=28612 RepID=UPI0008112CBB|nr:PREDICTED: enhancer of split m8 protein-like [Rhagoletis zephyria]
MAQQSKTEIYLKVKKPLLERQRRARINDCLESLKKLVAELQADDAVLRMDKAELLEQTLVFVRQQCTRGSSKAQKSANVSMDAFCYGYMNAVNEVSRAMASTPGMSIELGKSVMTHLGRNYNRLEQQHGLQQQQQRQLCIAQPQQQVVHQPLKTIHMQALSIECAPLSPASSGYHSDGESPAASPVAPSIAHTASLNIWRPW